MFKDIVLKNFPNATFEEVITYKNNEELKGVKVNIGTNVEPVFYEAERMSEEEILSALNTKFEFTPLMLENAPVVRYVVSIKGNENMLKNCKYDTVCDLAVVTRAFLSDTATTLLKNGTDKDPMPYIFTSVMSTLNHADIDMIEEKEIDKDGLYLITNEKKFYGSGAIADTEYLKKIYEKLGDFFIIPSSVHEILVTKQGTPEALKEMVKDVNKTLEPKDILSDSVYAFDGKKVSIVA